MKTFIAAMAIELSLSSVALARPGGGHTFSRGGGGGGADFGGGGGGADFSGIFDLIFWLVFRHPLIGIPLVLFGLWIVYRVAHSRESGNWDVRGARFGRTVLANLPPPVPPAPPPAVPMPAPGTQPITVPSALAQDGAPQPAPQPSKRHAPPPVGDVPAAPPIPVTNGLGADDLRQQDPDFSMVLFEDFAYRLYAAAHRARSDAAALDALAPYLSAVSRAHLTQRRPVGGRVRAVVVGSLRLRGVAMLPGVGDRKPRVRLTVGFESNIHVDEALRNVAQYVVESWHFCRALGTRTRPWKGPRTFGCPNCGAPFRASGTKCSSCGQIVVGGAFDWIVEQIDVGSVHTAPPALGGTAEEQGTDQTTLVDPRASAGWASLTKDDPTVGDSSLAARIRLMFIELQSSWSAMDLARVRPYVTDSLFGYLQFWIDAYKEQGLRNVVDGTTIERLERVKVTRDRHFDAVTYRVFARGRDYTVESTTSRVVGGDPARDRRYSEYWTLVRGASVRQAPRAHKICPACSAPLNVNMAGNCTYCGSLVTTGEFDWVLSKVEQDDVYRG